MMKAEQEAPTTLGWSLMNCEDIVKADTKSIHHLLCQNTDLLLWRTAATNSQSVFVSGLYSERDLTHKTTNQQSSSNMWLTRIKQALRLIWEKTKHKILSVTAGKA